MVFGYFAEEKKVQSGMQLNQQVERAFDWWSEPCVSGGLHK